MKPFRGTVAAAATLSTVLLGSGLLAAAPAQAASISLNNADCRAGVISRPDFSASTGDVVTITGNFADCRELRVDSRLVTSTSDIVVNGSFVQAPTVSGIFYVWVATSFSGITITFTNTTSNNFVGFGLGSASYNTQRTVWGVTYTGSGGGGGGGGGGGSSSAPAAAPQTFELSLTPNDGTVCAKSSESGSAGAWMALPGANDCKPPATKPNAKLLGWATTPNFPVAIAKRQVANGWGAYETFNADGQLTGVFIPAGGSTLVSAAGNLYAVWSE